MDKNLGYSSEDVYEWLTSELGAGSIDDESTISMKSTTPSFMKADLARAFVTHSMSIMRTPKKFFFDVKVQALIDLCAEIKHNPEMLKQHPQLKRVCHMS